LNLTSVAALSDIVAVMWMIMSFDTLSSFEQKCIRDVENQIFDNKPSSFEKVFSIDEPGKCRLIRRATKCFGVGSGGDEKSGFQGD
jgi:hypothetical protein